MKPDRTLWFRKVALLPTDLRCHVSGVEYDATTLAHQRRRHVRDFLLRAPVHPDDAGRNGPALRIGGNAAIELPTDSEGVDISRLHLGGRERALDRRCKGAIPHFGVLLGGTGMRVTRLVADERLTENLKAVVGDDRFETLGADVETDNQVRPGCGIAIIGDQYETGSTTDARFTNRLRARPEAAT